MFPLNFTRVRSPQNPYPIHTPFPHFWGSGAPFHKTHTPFRYFASFVQFWNNLRGQNFCKSHTKSFPRLQFVGIRLYLACSSLYLYPVFLSANRDGVPGWRAGMIRESFAGNAHRESLTGCHFDWNPYPQAIKSIPLINFRPPPCWCKSRTPPY